MNYIGELELFRSIRTFINFHMNKFIISIDKYNNENRINPINNKKHRIKYKEKISLKNIYCYK